MSRSSRNYSESGVYHILFRATWGRTFNIQNPKDIAKLDKMKRNEIIKVLKQEFPARQIQRITNVSRGVIAKL